MEPLRIAVALHCFGRPLKRALQAAAQTRAAGIQISTGQDVRPSELSETGRRQLLHYLDDLSLTVASVDFPTRRPLYDLDRLERRLEAAKEAMQLTYRLKARILTFRTGRIPPDKQSEEFSVLVGVLNDLARLGNHIGVTPALTTAGEDAQTLASLFELITQGPIGVSFDPAALVLAGQNPADLFGPLTDFVSHVVVRDAVREFEQSGIEVPLGRGEVPWEECLALLDEAGYRGWFTVDRTQGDDKAGDVARAVQYLRQLAME